MKRSKQDLVDLARPEMVCVGLYETLGVRFPQLWDSEIDCVSAMQLVTKLKQAERLDAPLQSQSKVLVLGCSVTTLACVVASMTDCSVEVSFTGIGSNWRTARDETRGLLRRAK